MQQDGYKFPISLWWEFKVPVLLTFTLLLSLQFRLWEDWQRDRSQSAITVVGNAIWICKISVGKVGTGKSLAVIVFHSSPHLLFLKIKVHNSTHIKPTKSFLLDFFANVFCQNGRSILISCNSCFFIKLYADRKYHMGESKDVSKKWIACK